MTKEITIPRESLSSKTKANLDILETKGFDFGASAKKVPVVGRQAFSYVISGTDPRGSKVEYHRHESKSKASGSTYLKTPSGNIRLADLLSSTSISSLVGSSQTAIQTYRPDLIPQKVFKSLITKASYDTEKGITYSNLKRELLDRNITVSNIPSYLDKEVSNTKLIRDFIRSKFTQTELKSILRSIVPRDPDRSIKAFLAKKLAEEFVDMHPDYQEESVRDYIALYLGKVR